MAESIYILGDEDRKKFARLIAAAWDDPELRGRYETEPRAVLAQYGIVYPSGVPTPPLPARPEGEFDIAELESAAGSAVASASTTGTAACIGCVLTGSDPTLPQGTT
ncbi:hypothetical protein [Sphaerimonospora thailandensis]|uniref:TOMM peptide n=1 Tax=Sphaerimonospora thailandensis TaxID=795644 RepID=A0A8J3W198_9ACTN|nr:hypothetical protein [Sphaerimonospora thailandensis]GIH72512.1 hypothetical protein Mth01_47650 [Sphaerimonospora thailandensis]